MPSTSSACRRAGGARPGRGLPPGLPRRRDAPNRTHLEELCADAFDDNFDTPRALAVLHSRRAAGQLDLLGRGLAVFGLAIDRALDIAPPETHQLGSEPVGLGTSGSAGKCRSSRSAFALSRNQMSWMVR